MFYFENQINNHKEIINSNKDLLWSIDTDFNLIYANIEFQQLTKTITGHELNVGDSIFTDKLDKKINKEWKGYYKRVLNGESFYVKRNFKESLTTYGLTSLNPLYSNENIIYGIICSTRDITTEYYRNRLY